MADFTADFEAGSDGATITTGAGEASATAWTTVTGSPVYDNDNVVDGALAAKFTATGQDLLWQGNLGATTYYGRFYLWLPAWPTVGGLRIFGNQFFLYVQTTGKLALLNSSNGDPHESTATIATGQWVRIEYSLFTSTTVGQAVVRYFANPSSETPTETLTSPANWDTGASNPQLNHCWEWTGSVSAFWMDAIVGNATDWVGPVPVPTQTLLPSADSADGSWTDQAGGSSLVAAIDEATESDTDYIRSELNPSASGCRVKLASGGDPHVSTDHIIHWRTGKIGSATINMTVKLYQGGGNSQGAGTLIASFDRNNVGSFTTYDETLSGGEADSITDYTDLYLEFFADTA